MEGNWKGFLGTVEFPQLFGSLGWQTCCHRGTSKLRLAVLQLQADKLNRAPYCGGCELQFQGAFGHSIDGGILSSPAFGCVLQEGSLDLPEDTPLAGAEHLAPMPHIFVADEAFPLKLVCFFE